MNKLSIQRLRSPFLALICVAAVLVILDVSMSVALGYQPDWMPSRIEWDNVQRFQAHVAAVEQLEQSGRLSDHQLVVILGSSVVEHGFDCNVMHAADPQHRYWLILGGGLSNFGQLEAYGRVLNDSTLRPATVVLGLQPSFTHQEDDDDTRPLEISLRALPRDIRAHRFRNVIRDCVWLDRNQKSLYNTALTFNYEALADVRRVFHMGTAAAALPAPDPWDVPNLPGLRGDAADWAGKWGYRTQLLNPSHYQNPSRNIQAFVQLVAELRGRGAHVIVMIMPETARLRALYPPLVPEQFHQALNAAAAGGTLPVMDLQAAISDDMFYDDAHLNTPGKEYFSALVPPLIQ